LKNWCRFTPEKKQIFIHCQVQQDILLQKPLCWIAFLGIGLYPLPGCEVWCYDFFHDGFANGQTLKCLTIDAAGAGAVEVIEYIALS